MEPENNPTPVPKTHLQFGILTAIIIIAFTVIYYTFGIKPTGIIGLVPLFVFMILIIIAQNVHAKSLQGDITYGNLFAMGFKTTAIAVCLYVVFIFLFILFVPGFKEHSLLMTRQKMELKGTLSEDQIDNIVKGYSKYYMVITISTILFIDLILGVIASLIGAAIPKKNPHPTSIL
jgi:Protein of unknown function (DUF4199)